MVRRSLPPFYYRIQAFALLQVCVENLHPAFGLVQLTLSRNVMVPPGSRVQESTTQGPEGVILQAKRDRDRYYDDENDDDDEFYKVPVRRRGRSRGDRFDAESETSSYQQRTHFDSSDKYYEQDDDDEEFYEEDDELDYLLENEEYDLFSDVVIPNPLLDSIDPDGAADRFPELARDPRFWFDIVLFVAALNFLSDLGPRNPGFVPWNDIPWQTL